MIVREWIFPPTLAFALKESGHQSLLTSPLRHPPSHGAADVAQQAIRVIRELGDLALSSSTCARPNMGRFRVLCRANRSWPSLQS
jgi:hypothetical protein